LAFNHQISIGGDFLNNAHFSAYWYLLYVFTVGNILFFRFLTPIWQYNKYDFTVDKIISETHNVTSVYITGRQLSQFKVLPGQFMIFRFLSSGFWWQAHPFSLSGRPDGEHLRISVKNSGDFTATIPSLKQGTKVLIDGPYGIFTERSAKRNKFLLIAGGIGITPIRILAQQLLEHGKDAVLIYGNRTQGDIVFKRELDEMAAKYHFPIFHVLSQQPDFTGEKGHIDKEKIHRLVPDISGREVFLCGPEGMMKNVVADLKTLKVADSAIHFEQFSL
jgi:ferredoxin-NADP reductase